jgi:hypothetical protein
VRLTAERNGTRAAIAGLYMELALVNEHERTSGAGKRLLGPRRPSPGRARMMSVVRRVERLDAHHAPAVAMGEANMPVRKREQGVVVTLPDAGSRVEASAALAHDDRPRGDKTAVEHLYAQSLCIAVTAVASATATLGLGHLLKPPW